MRRILTKPTTLRMADGGMFGGLKRAVGLAPPETVTQKFARQDAERAARAPAPAPVLAPAPQPAISSYIGNSALQRREAAAGLRDGGRVVGPGTGISDSVPARYSNGEYVLPTDTAQAIGYDKLDAIKDATHTPAAVQRRLRDGAEYGQKSTQRDGEVSGRSALRQGTSLRGDAEVGERVGGGSDRSAVYRERPRGTLRLADGGIPGIDVLERPWNGALDSRTFAQQPGPGNPNIGPSGSPQAQAFQQARAPQPVAPSTPTAQPAAQTGRLRSAVNATGNFLTGAGTSQGSVGGAFKNVLAPVAKGAASVVGKVAAPLAAGSAIAGGFSTDTEDYAKRFGLENTQPGLLRDLGVRTAGVASDSVGLQGTDTETYAERFGLEKTEPGLLRDLGVRALGVGSDVLSFGQASRLDEAPAVQQPRAAPSLRASNPTDQRLAAGTQTAAPATLRDSVPTLGGMAGTDMGGGISRFKTADGRTLYSNVKGDDNDKLMSGSGGTVSTPGSPGDGRRVMEMNQRMASEMKAEREAGEAKQRESEREQQAVAARIARDLEAKRERQSAETSASSIVDDGARRTARESLRRMDAGMLLAQKDAGETERARLAAGAADADSRRKDATTLRGQDLDFGGKQLTALSAAQKAAQEQFNADRTFKAGREDATALRGSKARDDKRAGNKAFEDRITSMVPTGADGKPDGNAAAAIRNGANAFLANKMAEVNAALQKDPRNPRALAIKKDIEENGLDGLDEDTIRTAVLGQKANQVARDYDSWRINPWGGTARNTDAPISSLTKKKGFIWDDYISDSGSGNQVIPARALRDNPDLQRLIRN